MSTSTDDLPARATAGHAHSGRRVHIRIVGQIGLIVAAMLVAAVALTVGRRTSTAAPTGSPPVVGTGPVAVSIKEFAFAPATLTIPIGTTVVWTNLDGDAHTVRTTTSATLMSATLSTNATYSYTFTKPGSYAYHCSIHAEMHGTVVVTK